MSKRTVADEERRRSPRFGCGGYANISRLPSDGIVLPGAIRDLSLGGCSLRTALPIDAGVRAEILLRVNSASFRAVGEVREIRGNSGVGVEFVHLSSGGKDMLADLVTELARLQAIMSKLKGTRREMDAHAFKEELERGRLQATLLRERFPFFGTTVAAEHLRRSSKESSAGDTFADAGSDSTVENESLVLRVDLFG
jgi:hypothetical protein